MRALNQLLQAVRVGDLDSVRGLLDEDPSLINQRNQLGQGAVLLAKYHRQPKAVALLLQYGPDLTVHEAAAVGDAVRLRQLLDSDAQRRDAFSEDGFSPLMLAAFFGNEDTVNALLERGADVNATSRNPMGLRALHSAAAAKHLGIVRSLVEAGADVNAPQQQGFTPLHAAAQNGDEEMVRFLLSQEARPDARSANGQSPLDMALSHGHGAVAKLLERVAS